MAVQQHAASTERKPLLSSVAHVSLPARDLDEAKRFFTEVLGGEVTIDLADFASIEVAGLHFGVSPFSAQFEDPKAEYPHYAFFVDAGQLIDMKERLESYGIPTGPLWTRNGKEALMFFKDPSGNLFELFCTEGYAEAPGLPRGGTRGGISVVDLATLNYDTWGK